MKLLVHGIETPVVIQDYITPELMAGCRFYPEYVAEARRRGQRAVPFQEYLLLLCHGLERADARPGRTRSEYLRRFLEHFGLDTLRTLCEEYEDMGDKREKMPSRHTARFGGIELRWDADGDLDEVVVFTKNGSSAHLERMDEHHVWVGLYDGDRWVHLNLGPGLVPMDVQWDNAGDTEEVREGNSVKVGNIEITTNKDGLVDEVFLVTDIYFHLERMSETLVWMAFWDGHSEDAVPPHGVHVWVHPSPERPADMDWDEDAGNP